MISGTVPCSELDLQTTVCRDGCKEANGQGSTTPVFPVSEGCDRRVSLWETRVRVHEFMASLSHVHYIPIITRKKSKLVSFQSIKDL